MPVLDWLFVAGFFLPVAYVVIMPGTYLAVWYRIISSSRTAGITLLIFVAGLLKTLLYLAKHLGYQVAVAAEGTNLQRPKTIGYGIFQIHMTVAIVVLLTIILAFLSRVLSTELSFRVFFAFLITEFVMFPVIGLISLQDRIRHRKDDFTTIFLLSAAIYLCIVFITTSDVVQVEASVVNIRTLTALETAGAKLYFLLLFVVSFVSTPAFWRSASLYSFDIAPPPIWVGGLYVVMSALFLYYTAPAKRKSSDPSTLGILAPVDIIRPAITILVATVLSFLLISTADLLVPHNFAGRIFQLSLVLAVLLLVYFMNVQRVQTQ